MSTPATVDPADPAGPRERGRALRKRAPRSGFGTGIDGDRDALAILDAQNADRLPELVPVRWGRMSHSAFTFYRGAAAVMAHDLASTPVTGVVGQGCGDAHLSNFGLYASPERELVFDLNDFDETHPAPWEWDVQRLAASLMIAAQDNGVDDQRAGRLVAAAAARYRTSIARLAELAPLERFHLRVPAEELLTRLEADDLEGERAETARRWRKTIDKARRRTSETAMAKLAVEGEGGRRIAEQPPLVVHVTEPPDEVATILERYTATVPADIEALLQHFEMSDLVLKVVGVGSVGTRCYLVLAVDRDGGPLFLQIKQAVRSVLEAHTDGCRYRNQGQRVVAGQRIMQAVSDPFLGWTSIGDHDYYVRQFRDMKGSVAIEKLDADQLQGYGELCASVLARAHAQTIDPALLTGYLGTGLVFDTAVAAFAARYAERNARDHEALLAAIASGRVTADLDH